MQLPVGIYEALFDSKIRDILQEHPEIKYWLGKIDPEEEPTLYARYIAKIAEYAFRTEETTHERRVLLNQILAYLSNTPKREHLKDHLLPEDDARLLLEVTPPSFNTEHYHRPQTPISESTLFTGSPSEPQLAHELVKEMRSADRVDILVSFIKWSGLRLLLPALEDLLQRNIPVRVVTTSYMGASDVPAVNYLHNMPNVSVRVSYDTERTRLHAKAYLFKRNSGFSSAYIGSANMSHPAMTSGLEWNLKVTESDMQLILEKFAVEFETYWNSGDFIPYNHKDFTKAVSYARQQRGQGSPALALFDLKPHVFQERILDALAVERNVHGEKRNLVVAATGTGKTVIAAFDFKRFYEQNHRQVRLLFVAHRLEILQQALQTFRSVLGDRSFGMLHGGNNVASRFDHVFCTVQTFNAQELWKSLPRDFYQFIIIDEVHHGVALSYRMLFDHFIPEILLGLTATPERMDGENVAADFGNRFAAEIRLPEALDEKLLCPFQYFGVHDPISISDDSFWQNGRYQTSALDSVYVLDKQRAHARVKTIIAAIDTYEKQRETIKGVGFCVSIQHAVFMAKAFNDHGLPSATYVSGGVSDEDSKKREELESGKLLFLFTVDRLSEGVDIAAINMVLFLRPTESLTVFLQQLGRGLRHAPQKECLTVLDFVGQVHKHYRLDTKFKALLPKRRYIIDKEIENDFPHMPAGCSIQLERVAKEQVLQNIRYHLRNLRTYIVERIQSFNSDTGLPLTFENFITQTDIDPEQLLYKQSWSEWKTIALQVGRIEDPDLVLLRSALSRLLFISGPHEIKLLSKVISALLEQDVPKAYELAGERVLAVHHRLWGRTGRELGMDKIYSSFERLSENNTILQDIHEILSWRASTTTIQGIQPLFAGKNWLELHAQYRRQDVLVACGLTDFTTSYPSREGLVFHPSTRTFILFITFQKAEKDFSPSTMYADYPISRELLHWESQSTTSQSSRRGQDYINHVSLGISVSIFVRDKKNTTKNTMPYTYLGPANLVSHESERPIKIVWQLSYPMPAEMFEENRRGG